jgi:phage-related protein
MNRWKVETLDRTVDAELDGLPPSLRARLLRLMEIVENIGLDRMREPHVRHLEGKLWELRAKAAEGIARGLYVTVTGRRVVVLHVFVKKSQKTPAGALAIAWERLKKVKHDENIGTEETLVRRS